MQAKGWLACSLEPGVDYSSQSLPRSGRVRAGLAGSLSAQTDCTSSRACLEIQASMVNESYGVTHAHLARSSSSCSTTDSAVPVKASGLFQGGLVGRPGGAGDCVCAAAGGALQQQAAPGALASVRHAADAGNGIELPALAALQPQAAPEVLKAAMHVANAGSCNRMPAEKPCCSQHCLVASVPVPGCTGCRGLPLPTCR